MMESKRKKDSRLGAFIWNVINDSGLTHQAVADSLDKSLRIVNMYCSGERKPSQVTLIKLLKLTNVIKIDIPF